MTSQENEKEEQAASPFRILSIDGGGYLGLATAAFIEGIEAHFKMRFSERFDLFCGTSTGAIIALGLAAGRSGTDLVSLYKEYGSIIFPSTGARGFIRRKLSGKALWSKYDNDGLKRALRESFSDLTLGDLHKKNRFVLIPAFNVTAGTPRVFKTDHSSNLSRDNKLKVWEVALASSSAPTFFPVTSISGETDFFCDGGVVSNSPSLMGFVEAQEELGHCPSDIRLLSLSTPRKKLAQHPSRASVLDRGFLRWKNDIFDVLIDSNSLTSHRVLERLIRNYPASQPRYFRLALENIHQLPIDLVSKEVTDDLLGLGAREAGSNKTRPKIQEIIG